MCPIDFIALKKAVIEHKRRLYEYRQKKQTEEIKNGRSNVYKGIAGQGDGQE